MDVTPQPGTGRTPSRRARVGLFVSLVVALATVSACATTAGHPGAAHHTAAGTSAAVHGAPDVGRATQGQDPARTVAARPHTVRHAFAAYDSSGRLAVTVSRHVSGSCWETSLAYPSAQAYRCLAGNTIYDPCFTRSGATDPVKVACVAAPWADATMMRLTSSLPKADPIAAHRPWAVRLSNGVRCVAATGTANFVHGVSLDYACRNGASAALRHLRSDVVTALLGRSARQPLKHVTVAALWRV